VRKIRVLLAELSPLMGSLLAHLVGEQPDMRVVGEVRGPVKVLLQARRRRADVVILPLTESAEMPGVCSHLLDHHPDMLVLALSVHGQSGVVYRRTPTARPMAAPLVEDILKAIRAVHNGADPGA
jgi:DNA-binding NarL/FixJ family response regulator